MSSRRCAFALFAVWCVSGCHVNSNKNQNTNNVDIGTPFGSMHVKANTAPGSTQTGLTPYPGATPVAQKDGDDGVADIDLSFGSLQFGVHAVDLRSADPQDKVLAFYRQDLKRYGDVLTCRGKQTLGSPARTAEGLTCGSKGKDAEFSTDEHLELRAGSERHQHIVDVHTDAGETRMELVALDLPGGTKHHDASDRE